MTIVYKVLKDSGDGDYWSVVAPSYWCKLYQIGYVTLPELGSRLYAFRTREAARQFKWSLAEENSVIFQCEAVGTSNLPVLRSRVCNTLALDEFWHPGSHPVWEVADAPNGSIWCDSITLVKKVS